MTFWLWVLVGYFAIDLAILGYHAATGQSIRITPGTLMLAFITHIGFIIFAVNAAGAVQP